jgi:plastocyanin
MKIRGRKISWRLIAVVVAAVVVAALVPVIINAHTREIRLVVRDMAFYLEGDSRPNPTIEVRAGERVRVVVRNDERGVNHDFAVPAVHAAVDTLRWNEQGEVTFEVPDVPGTYEYVCRPHLLMMKGTLRVVQ